MSCADVSCQAQFAARAVGVLRGSGDDTPRRPSFCRRTTASSAGVCRRVRPTQITTPRARFRTPGTAARGPLKARFEPRPPSTCRPVRCSRCSRCRREPCEFPNNQPFLSPPPGPHEHTPFASRAVLWRMVACSQRRVYRLFLGVRHRQRASRSCGSDPLRWSSSAAEVQPYAQCLCSPGSSGRRSPAVVPRVFAHHDAALERSVRQWVRTPSAAAAGVRGICGNGLPTAP